MREIKLVVFDLAGAVIEDAGQMSAHTHLLSSVAELPAMWAVA